jgi:hypothetical protein
MNRYYVPLAAPLASHRGRPNRRMNLRRLITMA